MQHALVDGRWGDPDEPKYNSFILQKPLVFCSKIRGLRNSAVDNFDDRFHAVHHKFPHVPMTAQAAYLSKIKCHLVFETDYRTYIMSILKRDFETLAKCWRPDYLRSSPYAKKDAELDLNAKSKLIESFTFRAYDMDEMGVWVEEPPFPFNMMEKGPKQQR